MRRIIRLEPPYIASLALVVALDLLAASSPMFNGPPPRFEAARLLAHFVYLVPVTQYEWIQPVYSRLAHEVAFYLAIGLLFPLLRGRGTSLLATALTIILVALGMINHLITLFVMGYVVHRHLGASGGGSHSRLFETLALVAGSVGAMALSNHVLEGIVGGLTALAITFHDVLPAAKGGARRALAALRAISYSLYLVHVPVGERS